MNCYYNLFITTVGATHPNQEHLPEDWRKQDQQFVVGEISLTPRMSYCLWHLLSLILTPNPAATGFTGNCNCRTASEGDTRDLDMKVQCSWFLFEHMESLRSSKDSEIKEASQHLQC